jgi:lipoate---protein ligase
MNSIELIPWRDAWSETFLDPSFHARLDKLEFDVIRSKARPANENLALDTALLYRVASGLRRPVFWLWDWSESAVVLGSYQSVKNEVDMEASIRTDTRIVRRMSGGGAMLVEPARSCTYSVIVPEAVVADMSYVQSFAFLDRWVVRALRSIGVPATYVPINDIASPDAKIGGAAQVRRAKTVLHHATLAFDMDNEHLFSVLRLGRRRLSTQGIPSAVKRVSPLSAFTTMTHAEMQDFLFDAFVAQHRTHQSDFAPEELIEADSRMTNIFFSYDWVYRVP